MGYTKHAVQGVGWNGVVKVATILLSALKIAVLARILSQADFGLFALVVVALGIIESATETGVNPTLIQSNKSIHYFLDTVWVISIVRGLSISILMIVMGFGMSVFYKTPQLVTLVGVASLIPFIRGFINPAIVSLQKDLRFFRDSVYRLALLVVEISSAILLGFVLRSVYAMIFGLIVSAIFEVMLTFVMFKQRPRFQYLHSRAQEIFHNMKGLNISAILGYVVENVDSLIVGKVIGTDGLGVYQNSYGLTHKLNLQLAKSVQHGTFPVYTKFTDDQERLQRAYLKTIQVSLGSFVLIALPFFFFPKLTILVLLGEKWLAAVPLIQPLLIAGIVQSAASISASLLVARRAYFWLNSNLLITAVTMIGLVSLWGEQYGLIGAVYGVLISRVVALPASLYGVYQTLHIPKREARRY